MNLLAHNSLARSLATLLAAAGFTAACGTPPEPDTIPAPIVTARTNGGGEIYGGFAFPVGNNSTALELDAPLKTENGAAYFSFTVNVRVPGLRGVDLQWRRPSEGNREIEKVAGPCEPGVGAVQRTLMEARARSHTGRVVPASYDQEIDGKLDAGIPLYWVTCEPAAPGEVIAADNSSTDYNLAILLPESLLAPGSDLRLNTVHFAGDVQGSNFATIPFHTSPTYFGVAGDSVAWGQGLLENQKYYTRLFDDIVARTGGEGRLRRVAHSGAQLNRPASEGDTAFIADAGSCGTGRNIHGEVPRRSPTIQCQIKALAAERCRTDGTALGIVTVPSFICDNDIVPLGVDEDDLLIIDRDAGPRYDFVFMTGCINDVGPFAMLLGNNGLNDTATLVNSINANCNLNNSLRDLRQFLPNATIGYMGYHFLVSSDTSFDRTGCTFIAPPGTTEAVLQADPVLATMGLSGFSFNGVVARSELFRALSRPALQNSIIGLNAQGDGAGRIVFINMDPEFLAANATLASQPRSFGLSCTGSGFLVPTDPAAGTRVGPCSTFANPDGSTPNSALEETCLRGSAFHPDLAGNVRMFIRTRMILAAAGRYPPP